MRGKGTNPHWRILDQADVKRVARKAAGSIANMNQGLLEEEDLYQDGLILIAATPHLAEQAIMGEYGLLYSRLRTELKHKFVDGMLRSGELDARKYKSVVIEDAESETSPQYAFNDGAGDYTDDAVRLLLPAVWDESYAYGLPAADDAPEQDMPKSAANKSRGNSHWAFIADIKTGWAKTPLTRLERRALFMSFGAGFRQSEIAKTEGAAQSTISARINGAISKITARLNGASLVIEEALVA